jgi:hypothetical protein
MLYDPKANPSIFDDPRIVNGYKEPFASERDMESERDMASNSYLDNITKNFKVFVWDFDDTLISKDKGIDELKQYKDFDGNALITQKMIDSSQHFSRDYDLINLLHP